ncbi:MAG: putative porin [Pseudomonadota bacterium]
MINTSRWQRHGALSALATVLALSAAPAFAQSASDYAALRAEVETLRAEQARSAARLAQLEAALAGVQQAQASVPTALAAAPAAGGTPAAGSTPFVGRSTATADASAAAPVNPAGGSAPGIAPASKSKLTFNGDLRVRYESNSGENIARDRDRLVMRGRLRALYTFNPTLAIGGELSTGDPNDPNSTDITLTGFDNDLDATLSQAYIRLTTGNLTAYAGKIPQPFVRTELVWDGDINPTGLSASYKFNLGSGTSLKANGLYFAIDENPAGGDSSMIGGQLAFETNASKDLKLELAGGYYGYRINSLVGADSGDWRTNRFAGGKYLSDFRLLDVIGAVQYNGFGDLWPVRVVGDYVHNFGATAGDANGFGVDLLVGRASKKQDWRFAYGYAQVGVDAVFAAFSHDNTNIATNYIQHTLAVDYVPMDNLILNVTYYRYKPLDALYAGTTLPNDWANRLRLNMMVAF